jgi:hypothetical protein
LGIHFTKEVEALRGDERACPPRVLLYLGHQDRVDLKRRDELTQAAFKCGVSILAGQTG